MAGRVATALEQKQAHEKRLRQRQRRQQQKKAAGGGGAGLGSLGTLALPPPTAKPARMRAPAEITITTASSVPSMSFLPLLA